MASNAPPGVPRTRPARNKYSYHTTPRWSILGHLRHLGVWASPGVGDREGLRILLQRRNRSKVEWIEGSSYDPGAKLMRQPYHDAGTFEFQAEVRQLLDIVIHSLYASKDIFVRELVSNASDALEKLRHLKLTQKDIADGDLPLEINITTDNLAKTVTIEDTGVGMTHAELIQNLGTIAHSGSKAFLKALDEGVAADIRLIGRFGLGFYSAFMAAKTIKVYSRSWRGDDTGSVWASDGLGTFKVTTSADIRRGTKVAIELKDEDADYSHEWKIREIVERYSAFVPFPINVNGTRVNTIEAVWLRGKYEVSEEEYAEFYRFHAHAADDPRLRLHFSADAPLAINALLFVPSQNAEKLGFGRTGPSVALYSRRVLVDARRPDLLPSWLRFVTGVVDSEDLPLHVSRETLQDKPLIGKLGKVITGRFLRFLEEEADRRPESYAAFYNEFGQFLKEGASLDFSHREQLAKLLRFESSATTKDERTSLPEYVSRMKPDQTDIYYLIGSNRSAIERGPYMEGFRARDLEVLYCFEPVDEYVMNGIISFDGKRIVAEIGRAHV